MRNYLAIVSEDIPSGWHVEEGDLIGKGIKPDMLVSLTAPKMCAKKFSGIHFLCGRFVPPSVAENLNLQLPAYPGTSMSTRISKPPQVDIAALRENCIAPEFSEDRAEVDPFPQFQKRLDDAIASGMKEPNAMALSPAGKEGKPYTIYESPKACDITENSRGALVFYWGALFCQILVERSVEKVADEESELHFQSPQRETDWSNS